MKKHFGRMAALIALPAVMVVLAGCGAHRPVVDPKMSQHPERYESDLAECQQLAEQAPGAGAGTVGGAGVGAALGAGLAVATGHKNLVGQAAGGGAVLGGAKGAGAGARERRQIVSNCMKGRGHAVLN
jgi:outer membrane lipoprotein SlyB